MKKVKITVMRIASYPDLMAEYENPISHACDMVLGQNFTANGWQRPEGFWLQRLGHDLPLCADAVPRGRKLL